MPYEPPKTIWSVAEKLDFNEPLEADDPRLVNTDLARGEFRFNELLRFFGVDASSKPWRLRSVPKRTYVIFCGHRGCGKSTELRSLAAQLGKPHLFCVCYADARQTLDISNLRYPDILMSLARRLVESLETAGVSVERASLQELENWFTERVQKDEKTRDFALEVKAGAEAKAGLPWLGKLFGGITNAFRTNSTHKEELRRVITNSFSEFAPMFNRFVLAAETALAKAKKAEKILFIVDGTDKLPRESSRRFFVEEAEQLLLIESNFIYSAPIDMLYQENQVQQFFQHAILPMIKLETQDGRESVRAGYQALRDLLSRRADTTSLFDSPATIDYLIRHSGGNPRELLKLLFYTFLKARGEQFDRAAAEAAVRELATDYRRILDQPDYQLLVGIDQGMEPDLNSERVRFLLFNLALLEYNSYWRRSHPVIRTLDGYRRLLAPPGTTRHGPKRKTSGRR